MKFIPFDLEYSQSLWEQEVDFNLTESGVHPLTLGQLLGENQALLQSFLDLELNYPHVNGIPRLRELIASLYPEATAGNVLVTVGAAEANQVITQTLLQEGSAVATLTPTYKQVWGIAANAGHRVSSFRLAPERDWALDTDELERAVNEDTRIIAVVNPNNPTGHIMTAAEMDAVVAAASRVGAWILADEVYRGAERQQDEETPSFFGRYDRVVAVGSMSKAYGLPGLRLGWLVAPPDLVDAIWRRHEYTTIAATMLSNHLAAHALDPGTRPALLQRARDYVRAGYPVLQAWLERHPQLLRCTPPQASAVAFVRYRLDMNSTELMLQLIRQASVLVGAGDHFGMDGYIRIAFGQPQPVLEEALGRIEKVLLSLA